MDPRTASGHLGRDATRVYRWERGDFESIRPSKLDRLLDLYGVTEQERSQLHDLLALLEPGWWAEFRDIWTSELPGLEAESTGIRCFDALTIPGLLQTPDYARAVFQAAGLGAGTVDRRTSARMARQRAVAGIPVRAVLDEAALTKRLDPLVMSQQILHLIEQARAGRVEIRLLIGAHPAMAGGSFVICDFADLRPMVHLETPTGGSVVLDSEDVDAYEQLHNDLCARALPACESIHMLASTADAWIRRGACDGVPEELVLRTG